MSIDQELRFMQSCSAVQNACYQKLYKAIKGVLREMCGDYEGSLALTRSLNDTFRQRTSLSANLKRKMKREECISPDFNTKGGSHGQRNLGETV